MEKLESKKMFEKKEKQEFILRANPKHPRREYRLGDVVVGEFFKKYLLNADEVKLLKGPEGTAWIQIGNAEKMKSDATHEKLLKDMH